MFRDSVVIVTGASSGIGWAVARACAAAGHSIVVAARRAEPLQRLVQEIIDSGGVATAVKADVRDPASMVAMAEAAVARYGRIDMLVANAGIGCRESVADASDDVVKDVFETNVLGVVRSVKAVLPLMIERRHGHIFTLSSVSTRLEWPNDALYASSKAAVSRFSAGLANEVRPHGILVTDVIPGVIETPLTSGMDEVRKVPPQIVANAIVRAIGTRRKIIVAPPWYRVLFLLHSVAPSLVERVLAR